jgi:predicted site-specific integrase-resolvase
MNVRIAHEAVGLGKEAGISYTTALRWFREGGYRCAPSRHRPRRRGAAAAAVALYARVSSREQKAQLTAQLGRLSEYA